MNEQRTDMATVARTPEHQAKIDQAMDDLHNFQARMSIGAVVKAKNPHRISVRQTLEMHGLVYGLEDPGTYSVLMDSVVPACCSEGCEVEPDGRCEHGCPSLLLAMGVI